MGAGPLFIIPKLFIYLRGLSDPFLVSGAGRVTAAGWGSRAGHHPVFMLTQQSHAWPGFSIACLQPPALGYGAWNTGRVGGTGVFSSPNRPAHTALHHPQPLGPGVTVGENPTLATSGILGALLNV